MENAHINVKEKFLQLQVICAVTSHFLWLQSTEQGISLSFVFCASINIKLFSQVIPWSVVSSIIRSVLWDEQRSQNQNLLVKIINKHPRI